MMLGRHGMGQTRLLAITISTERNFSEFRDGFSPTGKLDILYQCHFVYNIRQVYRWYWVDIRPEER